MCKRNREVFKTKLNVRACLWTEEFTGVCLASVTKKQLYECVVITGANDPQRNRSTTDRLLIALNRLSHTISLQLSLNWRYIIRYAGFL